MKKFFNNKKQKNQEIQQWLINWINNKTHITKPIDIHADYSTLGLYSILIADLVVDIETQYHVLLDVNILYLYPNIATFSEYLSDCVIKNNSNQK